MHAGSCCYTWENHGGTSSRDVTFIANSAEKSYNNPRGPFRTMLLQFVHVAIHIDSSITNITCTGYTLKTSQAFSQKLMDPASESHWQSWLMLSSMLLEVFWAGRVVRADLSVTYSESLRLYILSAWEEDVHRLWESQRHSWSFQIYLNNESLTINAWQRRLSLSGFWLVYKFAGRGGGDFDLLWKHQIGPRFLGTVALSNVKVAEAKTCALPLCK